MYRTTKPYISDIRDKIRITWKDNPYLNVKEDGYYPIFVESHNRPQVDHTDGIGTKGWYHWKYRSFREAVFDAFAMGLNDLAMVGALAYKMQVHLMLPQDDQEAITTIMDEIVMTSVNNRIAITGGETAILDTMSGMEIALTMSGIVSDKMPRPHLCENGDVLLGLQSSGIHSNGITFIRDLFKEKYFVWMTRPSCCYHRKVIGNALPLTGIMHITGGGFTRLKKLLTHNCDAVLLDWKIPSPFDVIFSELKDEKAEQTMYSTFNCGYGMVLACKEKDCETIRHKIKADVIGRIQKGNGKVIVNSMFSDKEFVL